MERRAKAAKNITEKDYKKVMNSLSQSLVYQRSIVKQQEALLKRSEAKKAELIVRRESAKKKLEAYLDEKDIDGEYPIIKEEYRFCLQGIDSLNKSITICEESIAEVKLGMDRTE